MEIGYIGTPQSRRSTVGAAGDELQFTPAVNAPGGPCVDSYVCASPGRGTGEGAYMQHNVCAARGHYLSIGGPMNWNQIFLTSAFTTTLMAALAFILRKWASARIKESISAEYKKALELFKQQVAWERRRKEQAAEVAELLSLWMKGNYDLGDHLKSGHS